MEKLTRKRPQGGPQPPPTYTSNGAVPDGYVTWNGSKPELRTWADRERCDAWVKIRDQHGTINFKVPARRKGTDKHHLN